MTVMWVKVMTVIRENDDSDVGEKVMTVMWEKVMTAPGLKMTLFY